MSMTPLPRSGYCEDCRREYVDVPLMRVRTKRVSEETYAMLSNTVQTLIDDSICQPCVFRRKLEGSL